MIMPSLRIIEVEGKRNKESEVSSSEKRNGAWGEV